MNTTYYWSVKRWVGKRWCGREGRRIKRWGRCSINTEGGRENMYRC
jgi:hypothetical protein